ncbi:MAG: class I SAM-dependent methyltransferase [Desulfovibrionaceae bacterium]|nr:class I SAM-dependent methyltransferase [Desulfovibrionaceae bacterium]
MCTLESVQNHAQWLLSSEGRISLVQKKRLLEFLLSGWPRRGHNVLEVGCGTGIFLQKLWEAGLDPTGLENSPELLDSVRKHMGSKVDLHLGKYTFLPFDDDEFDYVALISAFDFNSDLEPILAEAFRVARHGMLIFFNNSCSLAHLWGKMQKGPAHIRELNYISPLKMLSTLRKITGKNSCCFRTTLPAPPDMWKENSPLAFFNRPLTMLPFGAIAGLRVDIAPTATGTLLPLQIGSPDPV